MVVVVAVVVALAAMTTTWALSMQSRSSCSNTRLPRPFFKQLGSLHDRYARA